jgi:hypothetical protein
MKLSPIILDSPEFRKHEAKDRPLYERINKGKVIKNTGSPTDPRRRRHRKDHDNHRLLFLRPHGDCSPYIPTPFCAMR